MTGKSNWSKSVTWNRDAAAAGRIDKVFCGSMCDVMDDEAPEGSWEKLVDLINRTPNLFWQLLTKRPHRYIRRFPVEGFKHDNVILGATAENQEFYDVRVPLIEEASWELFSRNQAHSNVERKTVMTFVSYEPALGPVTMMPLAAKGFVPNWLIFGGETGPKPRPMDREWAENIKVECHNLGVAFFLKQFSARTPEMATALIPAEMLLRQFPEVK
jgi:protein gp37